MKKILLSAVCLVAVAAAGFGGYTYYENQTMDPLLKANLAALASIEDIGQGEGGMDCSYIINEGKCSITVGANGKIKVFGIGVLYAGADGVVSFDGKVTCSSGGNSSCVHVTCKDLYETIF